MRGEHQEEAEQTNAKGRHEKPFPQRLVRSLVHPGITMTYGAPEAQYFDPLAPLASVKTGQTS